MEADNNNKGVNIRLKLRYPKTVIGELNVEMPSQLYEHYKSLSPYNQAVLISDIVMKAPSTGDDVISVKEIAGAIEAGYASMRPASEQPYPHLNADPGCDCFL